MFGRSSFIKYQDLLENISANVNRIDTGIYKTDPKLIEHLAYDRRIIVVIKICLIKKDNI